MKNKILLSILAALGLATVNHGNSQEYGPVTFVDVSTSGAEYVTTQNSSGGSYTVEATRLTVSQTWTRDKVYILARNVIVPEGVTLTIEPGTLIRGERPSKGQGSGADSALAPADPGALVVARGGRIIAAGTASAPIIVTSMDDPYVPGGAATIPPIENKGLLNPALPATQIYLNPERELKTGCTPVSGTIGVGEYTVRGGTLTASAYTYGNSMANGSKWATDGEFGGIVIAGYAETVVGIANNNSALDTTTVSSFTLNAANTPVGTVGAQVIEGMAAFSTYAVGGGDEEDDDSGILRFMDVRYAGFIISLGKELNSYSFYGVGRNTVTEFLADWNNADDSFEVWGGSVNLRHCISAFPGDDGLDTDQGYTGTVQFYVQLQNNAIDASGTTSRRATVNVGDSSSENDGPEGGNSAYPYTVYTLANATFIGRGYNSISALSRSAGGSKEAATGPNYKDNGSSKVYNTLFMDSPQGAMMVMDRVAYGTQTHGVGGNSAINRFTDPRTSRGFDGANRASDLVTGQTGGPGEKDGLFNNVWFFRNGLLDNDFVGVNAKYPTLTALIDAKTVGNANYNSNWWIASDSNLFPDQTDRSERGASSNGAAVRANIADMITVIKGSNGVKFDQDPGVTVPLDHHLSGIDIKPTTSAARDLGTGNQLPNYDTAGVKTTRSLVRDASFVGAVRDSSWFRGWNFASESGCFLDSAVPIIPKVALSMDSVTLNPLVTFDTLTADVKYSLEVSTDNESFVPVAVLKRADLPYKDTTKTVGSNLLIYRVIAL